MTNEQMTLETCRYCETALVGAERNACDPCLDAICPACTDCFPDVDGQLCPDCFDDWMDWNDPQPEADFSETGAQWRSQMRFAQTRAAHPA